MSENYTAEYFAQATLATRGAHEVARRVSPEDRMQWCVYSDVLAGWQSDEVMAASGWVPVVEVEDWKQRIDDLTATHDDVKNLLKDTADDLRHDLALAQEELVDLRQENDRLERILQSPLTLKVLEVAWEAAEIPTDDNPIREGDVAIEKISANAYAVMTPPPTCGLVGRAFRVLSRAPREPWADLEDVLRDEIDLESDPGGIAHALHLKGWRKGGDDDE